MIMYCVLKNLRGQTAYKVFLSEKKRHKETSGGDRYLYYAHCADGFTGISIYPNLPNCIY